MVGWLGGWVVGWLVGWWVGGLVGWWVGGLVGWWVGGLVGWWVGGLVGWWVGGRWVGGLVGWWVGGLVGWWVGGLCAALLLSSFTAEPLVSQVAELHSQIHQPETLNLNDPPLIILLIYKLAHQVILTVSIPLVQHLMKHTLYH